MRIKTFLKYLSVLICLIMMISLASCQGGNDKETEAPTVAPTEAPTEDNIPTEAPTERPIEKPTETPLEHFEYEISEDKSAVYINRYLGTEDDVRIPDFIEGLPVTAINGTQSKGAFEDSAVRYISMPSTVSVIGKNAFKNCSEIDYIYFVDALREIGESAFENCSAIITCNLEFSALERVGE